MDNLYVIKLGSSTVIHGTAIYDQITQLVKQGAKILLVAGGAEAIANTFQSAGIEEHYLTLSSGNKVRYTPEADMEIISSAYQSMIIPKIAKELTTRGITSYAQLGASNKLVIGKLGKPLLAVFDGKKRVIKDSLYGKFSSINTAAVFGLLNIYDVVVFTPPIYDTAIDKAINIDADMLAANIAVSMHAAHLTFVTSTPGVLSSVEDETSRVRDLYLDQLANLDFVHGKMKQKIRASKIALEKADCDVSISGVHSLKNQTMLWRIRLQDKERQLLANIVSIPSVSGDEMQLTKYLDSLNHGENIKSYVDKSGNIILTKGNGSQKLYMLGHIDTVKNFWHPSMNGKNLYGRGSVDAKGPFATFYAAMNRVTVPDGYQLVCIGAVEEEISSSKGAFYVRDHMEAGPVIIGEPSGVSNVTVGYNGLFKMSITNHVSQSHSAGKGFVSSIDLAWNEVNRVRNIMASFDNESLSSVQDIEHSEIENTTKVTLNFRITKSLPTEIKTKVINETNLVSKVVVLRDTSAYKLKRSNNLVKVFTKAFSALNHEVPRLIVKSGTSDMNTLATKWKTPMVAYGPGNSSLDHQLNEHTNLDEFSTAVQNLAETITKTFEEESVWK